MVAKSKTFGVNNFIKTTNRKRPGRHSKKHKKINRGQGKPL